VKYIFFGDERGGGGRLREEHPQAFRNDQPQRSAPWRNGVHGHLRHRPRRENGARRRLPRRDRRLPGGGDELREKARIPDAGPGLFHVDAADVTRNGVADIIAVRYAGGGRSPPSGSSTGRSTGRSPPTFRTFCARPTSARKGSSSSGRRPIP